MVGQLLSDNVYDVLSVYHDAEHDVLAVETRRGPGRYEELTSVRVGPCGEEREK